MWAIFRQSQNALDDTMPCVCRPYDPLTYEDEVDDDDVMDEEGRTRLRLKVCSQVML